MVSIIILYFNIIILWDHRRIGGASLTETSLCGSYGWMKTQTGTWLLLMCTVSSSVIAVDNLINFWQSENHSDSQETPCLL